MPPTHGKTNSVLASGLKHIHGLSDPLNAASAALDGYISSVWCCRVAADR